MNVWVEIETRIARGESPAAVLALSSTRSLVAALAASAFHDPVQANAIATEILNRERRAPWFGAFIASVTTLVLVYGLDFLYTGTLLVFDVGARARILTAVSALVWILAVASFLAWRGRGSRARGALRGRKAF